MKRVRVFCDKLRDRLFESIEASSLFNEADKRVLLALWTRSTVRSQTVEDYPGHATLAAELGLTSRQVTASLRRLEHKGFVKATGSATRARQLAYVLNALLLEAAYDETIDAEGRPL